MELISLIVYSASILFATWLGYKMGKGEELKVNVGKMKAVIRTQEQTDQLIDRQSRKLDDRFHKRVRNG